LERDEYFAGELKISNEIESVDLVDLFCKKEID
jgi:hypothetical protein